MCLPIDDEVLSKLSSVLFSLDPLEQMNYIASFVFQLMCLTLVSTPVCASQLMCHVSLTFEGSYYSRVGFILLENSQTSTTAG